MVVLLPSYRTSSIGTTVLNINTQHVPLLGLNMFRSPRLSILKASCNDSKASSRRPYFDQRAQKVYILRQQHTPLPSSNTSSKDIVFDCPKSGSTRRKSTLTLTDTMIPTSLTLLIAASAISFPYAVAATPNDKSKMPLQARDNPKLNEYSGENWCVATTTPLPKPNLPANPSPSQATARSSTTTLRPPSSAWASTSKRNPCTWSTASGRVI